MTMTNLDAECAVRGHKLVTSQLEQEQKPKEIENSITKALGVLEEQGVYALFLYLHAREGRKFSKDLMKFLRSNSLELSLPGNSTDEPFAALQGLAKDLDKLLFARDILHQVLVYARYHAKAAGAASDSDSKQESENPKHTQPANDKKTPQQSTETKAATP